MFTVDNMQFYFMNVNTHRLTHHYANLPENPSKSQVHSRVDLGCFVCACTPSPARADSVSLLSSAPALTNRIWRAGQK